MIKFGRRSVFIVTSVAMLLLAFGAVSAFGSSQTSRHITRSAAAKLAARGVVRAEAAGIKIDAAAKRIMEAAPLGSCLNDPTQAKCAKDRPKAIVGVTGRGAHAAAGTNQCAVKATSLAKLGNSAHATAANQCSAAVTVQEVYVTLESFWTSDGQWHIENTGVNSGPGGTTIYAGTSFECNFSAVRAWENLAQGYADLRGVWYAAQQARYDNLSCVG